MQTPVNASGQVSYHVDRPKTILVVDDKAAMRQLLHDHFVGQGFTVLTSANGREALQAVTRTRPDVILLDLMMPEMDGYEFLQHYRQEANAPVIIITARDDESEAVLGLELGADDYVIKPFRMRELAARVKAVLRRSETAPADLGPVRVGAITLDAAGHTVTVNDAPVNLTPTEFNLLGLLLRAPGQVFTREQLAGGLTADGYSGLERTLNVHIRNLRAKIEPDPDRPQFIETVFGVGYRLARPEG